MYSHISTIVYEYVETAYEERRSRPTPDARPHQADVFSIRNIPILYLIFSVKKCIENLFNFHAKYQQFDILTFWDFSIPFGSIHDQVRIYANIQHFVTRKK
jgi:hypothetical protein